MRYSKLTVTPKMLKKLGYPKNILTLINSVTTDETELEFIPEHIAYIEEAKQNFLTEKERTVLDLRFGMCKTGYAIAEMLGITNSRVQQIIHKGLRKIRVYIRRTYGLCVLDSEKLRQG